jgi:hypothetical protein
MDEPLGLPTAASIAASASAASTRPMNLAGVEQASKMSHAGRGEVCVASR